jgi:HEAT repeat protein
MMLRARVLRRTSALVVALALAGPAIGRQALARQESPTVAVDAAIVAAVDAFDVEALRARGAAVMPELVTLYLARSGDAGGRSRVASAFYQLGIPSPPAAAALLADVQSPTTDEELKVAAQYALGRVSDDPVVVKVLLDQMRHGATFHLRDKAACALAYDQIHLAERQKVLLFRGLIGALADEQADVRRIAILALSIHTGQTRGYAPDAPLEARQQAIEGWLRWLAEYQANL